MRCDYIECDFGQLHARQWGEEHAGGMPIMCLPPSPFSSIAFNALAPLLAKRYHVIAVDYPGFGGSSAMRDEPTITDYSNAVMMIADTLVPGQKLRFLGFHTGNVIAADIALNFPGAPDHLLMIDVPFFDEERRREELDAKPNLFPLSHDAEMLGPAWEFNVGRRKDVIALPRAFENFVDMIASGQRRNSAFRASFRYDCVEAFSRVTVPATCIATAAMLTAETEAAARTLSNAELISLPEIPTAVLDAGAQRLAEVILARLAALD